MSPIGTAEALAHYTTYYQQNAPMHPLTKELIRSLIRHGLFDANYSPQQNGLQGLFFAELEDEVKPIQRLIVAYDMRNEKPIGVATIHRIVDHPDVDHVVHIFVKPEHRLKKIATELMKRVHMVNFPGLGMNETELSVPLLKKHRSIWPMRKPTVLDRDLKRCLRALEGQKYVTEDGSAILCSETVVDTLKAQDAKIKELQRQLDIARP